MRLVITMLLFMGFLHMQAQESRVQTDTLIVGRTIDKEDVKAVRIKMPYHMYNAMSAVNNKFMSLLMVRENPGTFKSGKSTVAAFNQETKRVEWMVDMKKSVQHTWPTKYGIFISMGNKITLLSLEDGHELWTTKIHPVYFHESADVILGYKSLDTGSSKILAFRMSTGEKLWEGKLPRTVSWGWNDVHELPGDRILVVADNINVIHLQTGHIESFEAKTGFNDIKTTLLGALASIAVGVTGAAISRGSTFYTPVMYGPNVVNGLSSNIYQQNSCFFIADRNSLRCFNADMQLKWQFPYPTGKASSSILFGSDNTVNMLNFGYGLRNGRQKVKHSRPFIASLNAQTGEPIFFNPLKMKKDIVEDAFVTPWDACFLFNDGVAYQPDINDSIVNITGWDTKTHGDIIRAVRDTVYVFNDKTLYFNPVAFDGTHFPILTEKSGMIVIDKDTNITDQYDETQLYTVRFRKDEFTCVRSLFHENQYHDYWLIKEYGIPLVHFDIPVSDIDMVDNDVYIFFDDNIAYFTVDK